jgi:RES domain-containing protein
LNDRKIVIADLVARYGSSSPILSQLPSESEVASKRSRIEFWAGALGYQRGMWKSWDGQLLALLVIPATVSGHLSFWSPRVQTILEYAAPYVSSIQSANIALSNDLIGFGNFPNPAAQMQGLLDDVVAALVPEIKSPNISSSQTDSTFVSLVLWRITMDYMNPLDGRGAEIMGGRWTSPGTRILYTCDSPLGAIEMVRSNTGREFPDVVRRARLHKILAEGKLEVISKASFLNKRLVKISDTRPIGDNWVLRRQSAILGCPSMLAPSGFDYLLNLHNLELKVDSVESFSI